MIFVTGATGFVGRRFVKELVKKFNKKDILCLIPNRNTPLEISGRQNLKELGIKTHYVDLVTGQGLSALPASPEIVFNLAANTEVLDPDHRANDVGMKNLVSALKKIGPKTHFVHISTLVIYSGKLDTAIPILETTVPSPTNEYSRSKWRGEQYLVEQSKKLGFRLTVFRPNTIYGVGGRQDGLFDTMIKLARKNSILARLNWPGASSLIFVQDVARALLAATQKPPQPGKPEIYILDPEALTLAQISELIYKAAGKVYSPIYLPRFFWHLAAWTRPVIYAVEAFLPIRIYNWLWRFSLVIDDVIVCDTKKFQTKFPTFTFTHLGDVIAQIVG